MPESPHPETLAWLHQTARIDGATYAQVLLIILERLELLEKAQENADHFVEPLEQRSTCAESAQVPPTSEAAPVASDEELLAMRSWSSHGPTFDSDLVDLGRACYNLGRQHGAAQPPTSEAAPVATDEELRQIWEGADYVEDALRAIYDLGRKHGAAQPPAAPPTPPPAPAGGLVERVALAIGGEGDHLANWTPEARAAIREVAAWLDSNEGLPDLATSRNADGWEMAAQILNQEVNR